MAPPAQFAQPQYAGVTSSSEVSMASGVPQFAAFSDASWTQDEQPSSLSSWDPSGASSSFGSYGMDAAPAQTTGAVSPGWYSQNNSQLYGPPPTNGIAIAGFVMSLLGWGVVSLFISIAGLKKANSFAAQGLAPAGSALAKWGIGISIWSTIVWTAVIGFYVWAFSFYGTELMNALGPTGTGSGAVTQAQLEQLATDQVIRSWDEAPASMSCPSLIPDADGMYDCTATMADGSQIMVTFNIL
jgi:hypothetical protein